MNDSVRLLLLKILKFNGDLTALVKIGYSYVQILNLIRVETEEGNIQKNNGVLVITSKGNNLIDELSSKLRDVNKNLWIEPEIASKIPRIDTDFLYLPHRDELTFI